MPSTARAAPYPGLCIADAYHRRARPQGPQGTETADGSVEALTTECGHDRSLEGEACAIVRAAAPVRRALAVLARVLVLNKSWERLGFARLGDYATERLGLSARTVYELAEVDRALHDLPRLDMAFVGGELSWTKLRLITRVARPGDQDTWLARARTSTAAALAREVRRVDVGSVEALAADGADDEPPGNFRLRCTRMLQGKWYRTRQLANRMAGRPVRPWECAEMIAAEVLSAVPLDLPEDVEQDAKQMEPEQMVGGAGSAAAGGPWVGYRSPASELTAGVAQPGASERQRSSLVPRDGDPLAADSHRITARLGRLLANLPDVDAFGLDARLRQVVRLEQQLDAELGKHLAILAREKAHRTAGFSSFAEYVRDRLGLCPRKARALLRLERLGERHRHFARAYHEGALSWVQANTLVPVLLHCRGGAGRAWIERAVQVSHRRLRDDVERAVVLQETAPDEFAVTGGLPGAVDDADTAGPLPSATEGKIGAQPTTSAGDTELFVHGPGDVVRLVRSVVCTVRRTIERETGYLPTEGEAFDAMLEHALAAWGDTAPVRRAHRVFARDGWRCTAPGCSSQQNLHDHHIVFRSAGGSNDLGNRTTLCAWHHLRGVHAGIVRCAGTAPDALRFDLGLRPGRPPLLSFTAGEVLCDAC